MKSKTWKVTFSWFGEKHEFYTDAYSPERARMNGEWKLSRKLGKDLSFVRMQLNNGDTVKVQEVEFK